MSQQVLEQIVQRFGDSVLSTGAHRGDETVVLRREVLVSVVQYLRDDPQMAFNFCVDITAVDLSRMPHYNGPRFEVVYHFHSLSHKHRIRLKVPLEESDLEIDSLSHLYGGANWFEREVWDMFGVRFRNSPDHRRILLYEEFVGHPLRKDYPQRGYQPLIDMPTLPRADEELPPLAAEDL